MSELTLVVFDVDGTLVDSQHAIMAGMEAAFAAAGFAAPTREEVLSIVGVSLRPAFQMLRPEAEDAALDAMVDGYKAEVTRQRAEGETIHLFPAVEETLRALEARPGCLLAMATGKGRPGVEHLLDDKGWRDLFVTTQAGDEHPSKPAPAMLEACLDATGVDRARAVMVGDTTYDLQMAVNAGVTPIGVDWGYHPVADLRDVGARHILSDLRDLPAQLDALWGA